MRHIFREGSLCMHFLYQAGNAIVAHVHHEKLAAGVVEIVVGEAYAGGGEPSSVAVKYNIGGTKAATIRPPSRPKVRIDMPARKKASSSRRNTFRNQSSSAALFIWRRAE